MADGPRKKLHKTKCVITLVASSSVLHLRDALKIHCYSRSSGVNPAQSVLHLRDALKIHCYSRPAVSCLHPSSCICSMHSKSVATRKMTVIPSSDTLHLRDALKNRCFAPRASISASIAMLHLLDALDFRCFGLDCRLVQERLMLHLPDALPPATIYSTRPA